MQGLHSSESMGLGWGDRWRHELGTAGMDVWIAFWWTVLRHVGAVLLALAGCRVMHQARD